MFALGCGRISGAALGHLMCLVRRHGLVRWGEAGRRCWEIVMCWLVTVAPSLGDQNRHELAVLNR